MQTITSGVARTTRDLVETEQWRGLAAVTLSSLGLVVDLALHHHEPSTLVPTIDHGLTSRYSELVITWTLLSPDGRASRPHQAAPDLVASATPRIEATEWAALRVLWERWHCQATSPGCAHQTPPAGSIRSQLAAVADCPVDGYRFGSGWLVRDLPRDVVTRARQVGRALEVSS